MHRRPMDPAVGALVNDPDRNDHAWQVLTHTAVVRDLLLEMCHEVSALAVRLARQLEALTLWEAPVGSPPRAGIPGVEPPHE